MAPGRWVVCTDGRVWMLIHRTRHPQRWLAVPFVRRVGWPWLRALLPRPKPRTLHAGLIAAALPVGTYDQGAAGLCCALKGTKLSPRH